MDYRELLIKYIKHIEEFEGINYIHDTSNVNFTQEELEELIRLEKENI